MTAKGLTTAQVDVPNQLVLLTGQLPQHGTQRGRLPGDLLGFSD